MKNKLLSLSLLLVFILHCGTNDSQNRLHRIENGLAYPVAIKGQTQLKMSISDRMAHHGVPGVSIAFIRNERIDWAKGYGTTVSGGKDSVDTETLFQAASISKPVAAMAALQTVEEGLADLDKPVNETLSSWKVPENNHTTSHPITLRGLLSHSAGLTVHGFRGYSYDEAVPSLIQLLNGEKPANSDPIIADIPPDSMYRYSGGGYCVAQQMLMDIHGESFPALVRKRILDPLEMTRSTYEQPLPDKLRLNAATGHRRKAKPIEGKWHTYPEMAAAGLWTTPSDLAHFAIEIMASMEGRSNKVLSQEMTRQMLTVQHGNYGLGLSLRAGDQIHQFGHGGSNEGFRCTMLAFPEKREGVVIMTNGDGGSDLMSEILRSLSVEYGWETLAPVEKKLAAIDPSSLDGFHGTYRFEGDFNVHIIKENDRLFIQAPGEERSEIFPESDSTFFPLDEWSTLTFMKNPRGEVTTLKANIEGQIYMGDKIE